MIRRMAVTSFVMAAAVVMVCATAGAGHPYHLTPQPIAPVYVQPPVYAYYGPPTVIVQRPVVVAQPVVVPEPVYVEVPTYVQPQIYDPAPVVGYPTTVRHSWHALPFGPVAKTEYRVHTPEGVHKYKHKQSWLGGYRYRYDFHR